MMFLKIYQERYIHRLCENESSLSLLFFFFFQLFIKVYQRFTCIHMTKLIAHKFSRGRRRLIQTYLYKFVEMTKLRVLTHCNITDISLNRMP